MLHTIDRYGLASSKSGPAFLPTRICAWCNTVLTTGTYPASHTICQPCLDIELAKKLAADIADIERR